MELPKGGLNQANLKLGMKSVHTADVRSAINNYNTNPITANRPPPIVESKQELPRRTRTALPQMRSGWFHIRKLTAKATYRRPFYSNLNIFARNLYFILFDI